jgi:hypothetical protein
MKEYIGESGLLSMAWLVSAVIQWLRPESMPAWMMDLTAIIFWIGIFIAVGATIVLGIIIFLSIVAEKVRKC